MSYANAAHYSICRKRYEKAEKEFIDSKLDLQLKSERKEQLTQHLYTIIQENELRKSKKLEELMSKLNMNEKDIVNMSNIEENRNENKKILILNDKAQIVNDEIQTVKDKCTESTEEIQIAKATVQIAEEKPKMQEDSNTSKT